MDAEVAFGHLEAVGMYAGERSGECFTVGEAGQSIDGSEAANPAPGRAAVLGEVLRSSLDDLAFVVVEFSTLATVNTATGLLALCALVWKLLIRPAGRISWLRDIER